MTLPGAPVITAVTAGDRAATVTWTAPVSNGGGLITGYVVTPFTGGVGQAAQTFTSSATTESVTGLTPGTSYTFTVAAVNAAGTGPASASSAAVTINAGPALTFAAPPAGEVSIAYSDTLTATGGTGALTWSVSSGTLPLGLTLGSSTGVLAGTPAAGGSYGFTVQVTDTTGQSATQAVSLVIAAVPSLSVPAPPSGQAGVAYSDPLAVTGGTGPFTWSVATGSLPAGVTLGAASGTLFGTPTTVGLSTFTVTVTDADGLTATQSLSITIAAGPLVIAASADTTTATQGGTVHYTITITNTAASAYSGVTFTVPLAGVLDDATYSNNAAATAGGTVSYASPNLTWTGNLAAGAAATVTFSFTVNNPYTGNGTLNFTVTSATAGTNCPAGSTDTRCTVSIPVSALTIVKTASVSSVAPGGTVAYTVTVTNTGQTAYTGASVTDSLTGVLANAAFSGNAAATSGSVSYSSPALTWTGNLAAGASATITYSVTVNSPDTGSGILANTVSSATAGSNCAPGRTDARCTATVTVLTPALTITKTANVSSIAPGGVVAYTVTVANSGQSPYSGVSVTDDLTSVLANAALDGIAVATSGSVSYASPVLAWTGDLAAGASAVITYSVTVHSPDTGGKVMTNTAVSGAAGSTCPANSGNAACTATVIVLTPALTITKTANVATATPGGVVDYTVTVTDSGQTAYTGATFTDPLAGVLANAVYNGDASVTGGTAGSVSYSSPDLTWTGNLAAGASATVTYSVTVDSPDTGSGVLASTVTSATAGSNCAPGSTDPRCTVTVTVAQLAIVNSSNVATTTPGGVVRFTTTFTNSGQVPYTGITIATDASNVLDHAAINGDQTATSGTLTIAGASVSWTGSIPAGGTVTVTGTVTVNDSVPLNTVLTSTITTSAAGSNCPAGGTDPRCSVSVPVLTPALAITKTANVSSIAPGGVVAYTITVTNSGQTPYTGASVTDDLTGVLANAAYNGDAAAAANGTVSYTSPVLAWTGDLAAGASAVITYSVTVHSPDTGGKVMTNTAVSGAAGSTCPANSGNAACTATVIVLTPALTITKTANVTSAGPGETVGYTITVTDSGQTPYPGATVTDDLTGVLDDAAYNGDANATGGTAGTVSYTSPDLTWTGALAAGASAVITYSVTVHNPDTGDTALSNTVTSTAAGSNCAPASTDPRCTVTIGLVGTQTLTFTNTANAASTAPGGVVTYTITVANSGQSTYPGAAFTDDLTGVLANAAYNGDAHASAGTVTYTSPDLTWTGGLAAGASVTITYSVTVHNPGTGSGILASTITSSSPDSNCAAASTDPRCTATVAVAQLLIAIQANASTTTPGGVVRFTSTFTNTGQVPYTGITIVPNASAVLANATPDGDQTATSGTLTVTPASVSWTGSIPAGQAVTISGSVTVHNTVPLNTVLTATDSTSAPGSNCPPSGGTDPRCTVSVPVLTPALTITKTADMTATTPGTTVGYTITVTDTGQTPYPAATVTDSLAGVLDDAAYNGDAAAASTGTVSSVSYTSPDLTWTGNLAVGATVTITYSVTVHNPDTADKIMINTAVSSAAGSSCPPGGGNAACTATVIVLTPALTITKTANAATTTPGGVVDYTITVTDTGQST